MRIAIIGTGGAALATAAIVARGGHQPRLVSLTGGGAKGLADGIVTATGALDLTFPVEVFTEARNALADVTAIVMATSADRYRHAIDTIVPHVTNRHRILICGELTQVSRALRAELAQRGVEATITSLATTLATGRRDDDASVRVGVVRSSAKASTQPIAAAAEGLHFWNGLFEGVLERSPSTLHITVANLNPIVHVPNALLNFTRMEKGEDWSNYGGITEGVASMMLGLDEERVRLARTLGIETATLTAHYVDNLGLPADMSLAGMATELHTRRNGLPRGPISANTRYVLEDVPFGLAAFERLGVLADAPTPLTTAVIAVASAMYGRDLRRDNQFLRTLTVEVA